MGALSSRLPNASHLGLWRRGQGLPGSEIQLQGKRVSGVSRRGNSVWLFLRGGQRLAKNAHQKSYAVAAGLGRDRDPCSWVNWVGIKEFLVGKGGPGSPGLTAYTKWWVGP